MRNPEANHSLKRLDLRRSVQLTAQEPSAYTNKLAYLLQDLCRDASPINVDVHPAAKFFAVRCQRVVSAWHVWSIYSVMCMYTQTRVCAHTHTCTPVDTHGICAPANAPAGHSGWCQYVGRCLAGQDGWFVVDSRYFRRSRIKAILRKK